MIGEGRWEKIKEEKWKGKIGNERKLGLSRAEQGRIKIRWEKWENDDWKESKRRIEEKRGKKSRKRRDKRKKIKEENFKYFIIVSWLSNIIYF